MMYIFMLLDCTHVKDISLFAFDDFQKLTGFHFVSTLRSCILGIYYVNVENSRTFPPSNKSPTSHIPIENKALLYALLDPISNSLLYHIG